LKDLQADINAAIKLENKLKDEKFIDEIKTVLKIAKIGFIDAAGNALHRLHETKPTIDAVKELIQGFPDALSLKNKRNRLPIQSAVWSSDATTLKYVPILAKEGIKHEVGGRGMRGGLLVEDPTAKQNSITLQLIVNMSNPSDPISYDTAFLGALKELRKDNLFLKKDIKDHELLFWSCTSQLAKMRFAYLADWDPDCLITRTYSDLQLSHAIIEYSEDSLTQFTMYFQTALKHHPQHLGMLFQKDDSGKTLYERAVNKYGEEKCFNVIKQYIPTDSKLPILHHVVKNAPKYMNDFAIHYLSAMYLRDEDGRTLTQATIASGSKTLKNDTMFFGKMTDDEIAELDPVTKQYPFLTCAACESSDLSTIYFLLSKNPSLLEKYIEQTTDEFAEEARSLKRKRDSDGDDDIDGGGGVEE